MVEETSAGEKMKRHAVLVVAVLLSAIACGITFLLALFRQFALIEVAASIVTAVELYLLSSSIGDWIEEKPQPNKRRLLIATSLASAVVLSFVIARLAA
jgi:MFS family permease